MPSYIMLSTLSAFFFNDTATTEIYTLSLHDALPISSASAAAARTRSTAWSMPVWPASRSEEHTSELQSLAYLVCRLLLEKKNKPERAVSGPDSGQRTEQGFYAVPKNLDADANEEEGREPQDDAHPGFADDRGEAIREAVAKINADCHERRGDHGSQNGKKIWAEVVRFVCPERDGHGNRAGTDSKRQGQRIKSAARNVRHVHFFLNGRAAIGFLLALEHGPAIGDDYKAAADLHDGNGNSKEIQDVRTDQHGSNQEDEAVHGHVACEDSAYGGWILARQGEKHRTAAQRIHDGKQGAEDQQDTFGYFQQGESSGGESIAEAGLWRTWGWPSQGARWCQRLLER